MSSFLHQVHPTRISSANPHLVDAEDPRWPRRADRHPTDSCLTAKTERILFFAPNRKEATREGRNNSSSALKDRGVPMRVAAGEVGEA
jgi:hypothetical protein